MSGAYDGLRLASRAQAEPDDDETEPGTEPDEDEQPTSKKKDKPMTTNTTDQAALDAARAQGFAEATARTTTVLASEHYAGREALAAKLLGNDKLSAEEIVETLAVAEAKPAAQTPPPAGDDDEDKARAELRQNLASEQPGNTTDTGEETAAPEAQAAADMKAAVARANELAGH